MMPSTTEALLDVNVLIASVFEDHPEHGRAARFVEGLEHFYTCPTTQGGFLRFATRPWKDPSGSERPPRLRMDEAQSKLKELAAVASHVFLPDDLPFSSLPLRAMTGHRQWTDAYLLSVAQQHHLRLASLDTHMSNMDDPANPALLTLP